LDDGCKIHGCSFFAAVAELESLAVNNLDDTLLMLLVRRSETESDADLFAYMQTRYDARLDDSNFGPAYKIGPTFVCRDQKFVQIKTFAGSLIMRIVSDTRKGKFERSVLFRFDFADRFRQLSSGGSESEVDDKELIQLEN
jgi:hypothetical protein